MKLTNKQTIVTLANVGIYSQDAKTAIREGNISATYIWTVFAVRNAKMILANFETQLEILTDLQNDISNANSEGEFQELRQKFYSLLMKTEGEVAYSEDSIGYNNCSKLHPFLEDWFTGKI
jgi:hypothetical protein